jgi:hypothetical protein
MQAYESIVDAITITNRKLQQFWSSAHGWAPEDAAELLNVSRLDWQVSLSKSLSLWAHLDDTRQGDLILAWANLGALIEGSLKLFLSVFLHDYTSHIDSGKKLKEIAGDKKFFVQFTNKQGLVRAPDIIELEKLIQFFAKLGILSTQQIDFLKRVQQKRNAIHAYKNRNIGNFSDFHFSLNEYWDLLSELEYRLPYPD